MSIHCAQRPVLLVALAASVWFTDGGSTPPPFPKGACPSTLADIRAEPLFQFIDKLPKGGNLHTHSGSYGSFDIILDEGFQMEGCHVFLAENSQEWLNGSVVFFKDEAPVGFQPCAAALKKDPNLRDELLTMWTAQPAMRDDDSTRAWDFFGPVFKRLHGATHHRPFLMKYLLKTLELSLAGGLQHMETRVSCSSDGHGTLTDLDGNEWSKEHVIDTYREVHQQFQNSCQECKKFSLRIIVSVSRYKTPGAILKDLDFTVSLMQRYPGFVIGWDAVAQEDPGHRTIDYVPAILEAKALAKHKGVELPMYLHDGESDDRNNSNVVDALLLGCPRIGHGINTAVYFPRVQELLKARGVAVEVNPISNQILRYVDNLESHPCATLALNGVPIVISSDDPGIFGYTGNSFDWFEVAAAWKLDLKSLKTLAFNSLQHSGLKGDSKLTAMAHWKKDWSTYIEQFVSTQSLAVTFA